ncbi:porin [Erwinia sp. S43]|uniref:porin n=1 Tax=unclassified Erwinia TaxID=2622719 RepID=UPI00190E55CF|nr:MULTISPECIES: porin [unclassified Erwinia]MBK0034490.1 porin [Erwinia sp. S43]MCW1877373.1 porin [Erwinia sp. INIA01]
MNKFYVIIPFILLSHESHSAVVYSKESNKLDIYGKISPRHYFSDLSSLDGDKTYFRIGLRGETSLSERLIGFARWEMELKGNNPESTNQGDKTRYGYAGLKDTTFGSIDYGRNLGVLYDIGSWTDMLPEFGSDTWSQNDVYMAKRTTGVLTWRTTDFFNLVSGLNLAIQYQGKNEQGRNDLRKQNGNGVGAAVTYKVSDLSAGLTYAASDRTLGQKNTTEALNATGEHAEAWASGIKYDNGHLYAAAVYANSKNMTTFGPYIANEAENFESVVQYQFENGIRPSIAYLRSRGHDIKGYGNPDLVEYISIGAFYYLTKNVSAIVDYKINLINANDFTQKAGINTDDVLALGLTYAF